MALLPHRFRLDSLRRSSRLALFVLIVMLARIGMVAACAPDDFAELAGHAMVETAVQVDSGAVHDDATPDESHGPGHCLHCGCHHAVALPAAVVIASTPAPSTQVDALVAPQVLATPDPGLRPPIG
jgi:hypothetical protein